MSRTALALLILGGCASAPTTAERLREVGRDYRAFAKVNAAYHWAPTLCAANVPAPGVISRSADAATHGRKLYNLWARHEGPYEGGRVQPGDQVLVKESWDPVPASAEEEAAWKAGGPPEGVARLSGRFYRPGGKKELYVMLRSEDPDADQGWIYAVLTPEGTPVLGVGGRSACADCHVRAGPSRVFGLPRAPR
jgi:hypothetical protein